MPDIALIERLQALSPPDTSVIVIEDAIKRNPAVDARGRDPFTWNPPTQAFIPNPHWIPTYDLHAAAADIWEEHAASLASAFDFSSDGQTYNRSQRHAHAMRMVQHHRSRRMARSVSVHPMSPPCADAREENNA
jgi:hypothetical protein